MSVVYHLLFPYFSLFGAFWLKHPIHFIVPSCIFVQSLCTTFSSILISVLSLYLNHEINCNFILGNNSSRIVTLKAQEDDPKKRRPDIKKAKKYLNWQPKVQHIHLYILPAWGLFLCIYHHKVNG